MSSRWGRRRGPRKTCPTLTRAHAHKHSRLLILVNQKTLELGVHLLEMACLLCFHVNLAVTNKGNEQAAAH